MADTKYSSISWAFDSRGIMARPATDHPPNEHFYQSMTGVLERGESALSTRYGSTIISRDPDGTVNGQNYPLPSQPVTLGRMKSIGGASYRYAGLIDGSLWRRAGTTQGPYAEIATGLSGQPFTTLVTNTQGSSQPFLFCFDKSKLIKDNGTGSPTRIGIFAPTQPVIATQYAPQIQIIDGFGTVSGYTASAMTPISASTAFTVAGTGGTSILSGDHEQYTDATGSYTGPPDGMIAKSVNLSDGIYRLKFATFPVNNTYNIVSLNSAYDATDSFTFTAAEWSIGAATTGYIGKTVALNLVNYQGDDLIVVALQVSNPQNIQEIRVEFDVNGSGYGASYYYKSIIPVSYQGNLSAPQTNDPTSAMVQAVFDTAIGVTDWSQQIGQPITEYPTVPTGLQGTQPSQLGSGQGSWSVIYLPKGQFQSAGNAGQSGADWSKITGWRVQVTTNSNGSSNVSFNGLYIQGSPTATGVGTNAGASSYGGVGYDFRTTYWDANTLTESNGSPENHFSVTPSNPGGESTIIVLRQAIDLALQYTPDPQATHVRIYARGGVFGNNWYYADQVPNITGTGTFHYRYILPDSALEQGNILSLTNDVPVTAPLPNPIATTITGALAPLPVNTNTPTLLTIAVAQASATFIPNQIVVLGNPQNQEQVYVVAGGTGSFTAYVQLPHTIGEPVNVFAAPGQTVFLAAIAYGQVWMAGDDNNPNSLYYTPKDQPQYCPPQNRLPIGSPTDPITAVINHRGILFVRTRSTYYQIAPGSPPTYQTTGSKHGSPANFDWCLSEREVWYAGWDGLRTFVGADGEYKSLIIEWLFRNNHQAVVPLVDLTQLNSVVGAFKNNTVTFSYVGQDGNRHRLMYSATYKRWRNDDVQASAMLVEEDTNQFVYAVPYPGQPGGYAIVYEDITKDYDDGGWVNGALVQTPIAMNLQMPYMDLGVLNNQKQWNALTIDANPNGQTIGVNLLFDDNNGSVAPINLGTFTGAIRAKYQFIINGGGGQQAYRISPVIGASVTSAPIIYQADISAAVLADQRNSYDSYWQTLGSNESKLIKQAYIDYTTTDGNSIAVQLFADGGTAPYYTFTLAPNTARAEVPVRVRFPALKLRLFRIVMTSSVALGQFQIWSPISLDRKFVIASGSKGYQRVPLSEGLTP